MLTSALTRKGSRLTVGKGEMPGSGVGEMGAGSGEHPYSPTSRLSNTQAAIILLMLLADPDNRALLPQLTCAGWCAAVQLI
jgi:hypothetical protein